MAALPIGAAITVAARSVLGIRTVGVFAPVLLALTVSNLGMLRGLAILAIGALAGVAALPVVDRLALPRIARLALVLCAVCAGVQAAGFGGSEQAALPVMVLSVVVERGWDAIAGTGWRAGSRVVAATLLLSAVIAVVLSSTPMLWLLRGGGLVPIIVGALATALAGSYRGLRLGERRRFESLLSRA